MNKRTSDWALSPDWLWHFGTLALVSGIAALAALLLPLIARLKSAAPANLYATGVAMGAIGTLLLCFARLPLYRQRRFWTAGPALLDRTHRRLYWLAYACILASLLLLGLVWMRTRE